MGEHFGLKEPTKISLTMLIQLKNFSSWHKLKFFPKQVDMIKTIRSRWLQQLNLLLHCSWRKLIFGTVSNQNPNIHKKINYHIKVKSNEACRASKGASILIIATNHVVESCSSAHNDATRITCWHGKIVRTPHGLKSAVLSRYYILLYILYMIFCIITTLRATHLSLFSSQPRPQLENHRKQLKGAQNKHKLTMQLKENRVTRTQTPLVHH